MSNNEKIIEIVESVQKEATNVAKNFDRRNDELQKRTRSAIDVYSGTALSQVASIVTETRNMSEELYVSMQSYVTLLDSRCKALLDDDIPLSTIKKVWDLIVWLNEQSDIHISFTSQLNYNPRNDVADVNLFPTVENKFIQKEWENRYKLSPKYEEEQKRIEEEKKEKEAKKQEMARANEKIEAERSANKEKHLKGNEEREKMIADSNQNAANFEKNLEKRIEVLLQKYETENLKTLNQYRDRLKKAESQYATLGFFKFAEKKAVKAQMSELNNEISRLESPENLEKTTSELKQKAEDAQKTYRKDLDDLIDASFTKSVVTVTSSSPNASPLEPCSNEDEECILSYIGYYWRTISDICNEFDFHGDSYSPNQVNRIIQSLKRKGHIIRMESLGKAYYALPGTPYQEQVEVWKKTDKAPETLPQPPKVEDVLKF